MRTRPLVGVPADRRQVGLHPFHMVGEKYLDALIDSASVLPLVVPVMAEQLEIDALLNELDGVLLTGSPSNVEPERYGADRVREDTLTDPYRDALTLPLATSALQRGIPLFAICRGFQELNVALGGTLHQHLHEVDGFNDHREDSTAAAEIQYGPAHRVTFAKGGWLEYLYGARAATVNSLHGQGVAELAAGVTVEAVAEDGLVEAFTVDDSQAFAVAVQWHPEWRAAEDELSAKLFGAFGDACRLRMNTRS